MVIYSVGVLVGGREGSEICSGGVLVGGWE
jgi:hypothetical protein